MVHSYVECRAGWHRHPDHGQLGLVVSPRPSRCYAATPRYCVRERWRRGGGGGGGGVGRHRRLAGPVAVVTAPVVRRDVPVYVDGIGTVQAFNTVTVRARVSGHLEKIAFLEGQDVQPGDVLAQIDPRPYQAKLTQMLGIKAKDEAQLANAKIDLDRYEKLLATAAINNQQFDTQKALVRQLEASLQTDQANIDAAALDLDYATIRAPISGRVGMRLIDAGNYINVREQNGIVIITQLEPVSVAFSLPQQHLVPINEALAKKRVSVIALNADGKTVLAEGVLAVVDNRIDTQTGTMRLKATFQNRERKLWPGQFVNVRVLLEDRKDVTAVPAAAVQRNNSGPYAYVVGPGEMVELRPICVGQIDDGIALVESGLQPGQRVVVTSQEQLRPGARVVATENGPDFVPGNNLSESTSGQSGEPGSRQRPLRP